MFQQINNLPNLPNVREMGMNGYGKVGIPLLVSLSINFVFVRFASVYAGEYKTGAVARGIDLEYSGESGPVPFAENVIIDDQSAHQIGPNAIIDQIRNRLVHSTESRMLNSSTVLCQDSLGRQFARWYDKRLGVIIGPIGTLPRQSLNSLNEGPRLTAIL